MPTGVQWAWGAWESLLDQAPFGTESGSRCKGLAPQLPLEWSLLTGQAEGESGQVATCVRLPVHCAPCYTTASCRPDCPSAATSPFSTAFILQLWVQERLPLATSTDHGTNLQAVQLLMKKNQVSLSIRHWVLVPASRSKPGNKRLNGHLVNGTSILASFQRRLGCCRYRTRPGTCPRCSP